MKAEDLIEKLNDMTTDELELVEQRAAFLLRDKRLADARAAAEQLKKLARAMGLDPAALISDRAVKKLSGTGAAKGKGGYTIPPKYRSADGQHEWSGRGKTPRWVEEYIAAGGALDDLLIQKEIV